MKSRILLPALFALSMTAYGQNLSREVLYRMAGDERLAATTEHFIDFTSDGKKFALLTQKGGYEGNMTLVFNGKRIPVGYITKTGSQTGCIYADAFPIYMGYINVNEPDGYIFKFTLNKKDAYGNEAVEFWVNRRGNMEGPYDYVWFEEEEHERGASRSPVYRYTLAGRVYENRDGKISPFMKTVRLPGDAYKAYGSDVSILSSNGRVVKLNASSNYIIAGDNYMNQDSNGLYLNGERISSSSRIWLFAVNAKGDYAYAEFTSSGTTPFDESKKYRIIKNGSTVGNVQATGIGSISEFHVADDGNLSFIIEGYKDGKNYARLYRDDLSVAGEYSDIISYVHLGRNSYALSYKKDNDFYIETDKEVFGPYDGTGRFDNGIKYDGRHYAFKYYLDGVWHLKTDKMDVVADAYYFALTENGDCVYSAGGREYRNGVELEKPAPNSLDVGGHSFFFDYGYDYVVIDGRRHGNAIPFKYRYDKDRNSFEWYCMENKGKDLVCYLYSLD